MNKTSLEFKVAIIVGIILCVCITRCVFAVSSDVSQIIKFTAIVGGALGAGISFFKFINV